jgi:hypothetical protein
MLCLAGWLFADAVNRFRGRACGASFWLSAKRAVWFRPFEVSPQGILHAEAFRTVALRRGDTFPKQRMLRSILVHVD